MNGAAMPDTPRRPVDPELAAARAALSGLAEPPGAAYAEVLRESLGPAGEWAVKVSMMDPPEIFYRTEGKLAADTNIADRRDSLLGQVDGAREEYAAQQARSARFFAEFRDSGQGPRSADGAQVSGDGARQVTGGRVDKANGSSLKKG
jgi:hypothetical protein